MTKPVSHNFLYFLVVLVTISLFSCENKPEDIKKVKTQEIKKEEFGRGIEILITKKGSPNIKITAPKVVRNYSGKPFNEFPEGMNLYVYNPEGTIESTLTAKYGRMADNSTEMIAKDSVVVIDKEGKRLNTEHLIWDKINSKIKTEGFVKIQTLDEIIYGDGFESNDDFTQYQITNIHGIVRVKEGEL